MWYNVDFRKLSVLLLPTFLRKPIMVAFVRSLSAPFVEILEAFNQFRDGWIYGVNYKLAHNSQVCKVRKVLNDRFDPQLRRIYIGDGNTYQRQYIYTRGEKKTRYLGKMYLRQRSDYADTGVDAIIYVPAGLQYNEYEFKAFVDSYRLVSKRYKIVKF